MAEKTVKVKNIGGVDFHSQLGVIKSGALGLVTVSESQNHTAKLETIIEKPVAAETVAAKPAAAAAETVAKK